MVNFLLYAGSQCPDTFSWNVFFVVVGPNTWHVRSQFPNQANEPTALQWKCGVLTTREVPAL